jgi:hypothetical protein
VPSATSTLLLTEGVFSGVSIFAIQYNFADYLTAIDRALDGDYAPLLALTEAWIAWPPPNPLGGGRALSVVVACNEYSAPFDLAHKLAKRGGRLRTAARRVARRRLRVVLEAGLGGLTLGTGRLLPRVPATARPHRPDSP